MTGTVTRCRRTIAAYGIGLKATGRTGTGISHPRQRGELERLEIKRRGTERHVAGTRQ